MSANPKLKFKFLNELDLSNEAKARLTTNLDGIVKGSDLDVQTPLIKDIDPSVILEEWNKIFESNKHRLNSTLIDLEYQNKSKFGPRSIAKPWKQRITDIKDYYSNKTCRIKIPQSLLKGEGTLRPIKITTAANLLKSSTSSGLPFMRKKKFVKDSVIAQLDELLSRKDPCVLFTRTQEGGKTRNVWGYPIADTLNEMRYYKPLLEYQKTQIWRSAIVGPEEVDKRISELINRARKEDLLIISVDFSAYDASISTKLMEYAFIKIKNEFQKLYGREIDYIFDRTKSIGLLTPSGVFKGEHGVPSGSTFTNEVDSIIQYLVAMSSGVVNALNIQVQGDDGVIATEEENENRLYLQFKDASLNLNIQKSRRAKDHCIYLQKLYHVDYMDSKGHIGGIYPVYRALNRLCYQERFTNFEDFKIDGQDYYSIRSLSILENCKNHPLFEEFVKFIKSKDKYSLAFSKGSAAKYVDLVNKGTTGEDVFNHQYGTDVRGIKSFESYKIVNDIKDKA